MNDEPHGARRPLPAADVLAALPPDGGPQYNRLVFELSPYLLQHAANPVDWYPWGDQAFERARAEDKPIFLSIGYSTCHWCHVMERECFEDEEVAALLNRYFVCVKVDREERPDIDQVYMAVTQALTGSGGWPMTVMLTPDKRPFFAGTYFPKYGRYGRPGMMELVPYLGQAWRNDRDHVLSAAHEIVETLTDIVSGRRGESLGEETLDLTARQLNARFDPVQGGFGNAPKFPTPRTLSFLLRYAVRRGDANAAHMVDKTLEAMRLGGIYDHIGFGFHRYSTDAEWLVPHFEKMLYDQALAMLAYAEAAQYSGRALFKTTAREVATYVLRDMTAPEGGFYSAEDADSEGVEGKFYVWTTSEIRAALGETEAALFNKIYRLTDEGNYHEEATGMRTGQNIPHLARPLDALPAEEVARLERARQMLFALRARREHPLKDDKILTDWSGLMIAALSVAACVLDDASYLKAAAKAADFVLRELRDEQGRLRKRYRLGRAGLPAQADDYAYLIWGLIELYQAGHDPSHLRAALELNEIMLARHWDAQQGGLFLTADDSEPLPARCKDVYDGALPSGNGTAAWNLVRLARLTGNLELTERTDALVRAFSGDIAKAPAAYCQMMIAVDALLGPWTEIVIVGAPDADDTRALLREVRTRFLPRAVLHLRSPDDTDLRELAPYTASLTTIHGKAAAYICRDFACQLPTTEPSELGRLLDSAPR